MYRPLPESLTIKESDIEGLGLFATEDIPVGTVLGVTHVMDHRFDDDYIRTPLGGFYNHSEDPNCESYDNDDTRMLMTIKDIKKGEEITCEYSLYEINEE